MAGGEWAIGRWEGNAYMVGAYTATGAMGLNTRAMLLQIDRESSGRVTCRFSFVPPLAQNNPGQTKRCVLGPEGISLTSIIGVDVDLKRSAPDRLTGKAKALLQQAPGLAGADFAFKRVE